MENGILTDFYGNPIKHFEVSMENGILTDFYGNPIKHFAELPFGIGERYHTEGLSSDLLPIEGLMAGMTLKKFTPQYTADPVCLYDRFGRIVKQWPEDYMPDYEEIRQAVKGEFERQGRRW